MPALATLLPDAFPLHVLLVVFVTKRISGGRRPSSPLGSSW